MVQRVKMFVLLNGWRGVISWETVPEVSVLVCRRYVCEGENIFNFVTLNGSPSRGGKKILYNSNIRPI